MNIRYKGNYIVNPKMMDFFNTFIFHWTYLGAQDELEDKSHH